MASTINSDNGVVSGSSGVKTTADTSGVLALQSNGTTGLTLNTSLALGVGSGNSTGSSGQVLTSAGSAAAPTWTTISSAVQYPQNIQSANYTLVLGDAGKQIFHPVSDAATRTYTIPANSSVAFPIGTVVLFTAENGGFPINVTINSDTLVLGDGTTSTPVRVSQNNTLAVIKVTATKWMGNFQFQYSTGASDNLAVAHDSNPYVTVYPFSASTGFGTKYTNPTSLPVGASRGAAFSPTGLEIALASNSYPNVQAYAFGNNGFGAKYATPATPPANSSNGVAFSPSGNALAVAHSSSPYISVYPWSSSGFGTKYANPSTLPSNTGYGVAFSPAGDAIAVSHFSSPYIAVYAWSVSGFGTKYSDPATLPPSSIGTAVAFSPSGADIAVCSDNAPSISVYPWSSVSGFGSKYSDPATTPVGGANGVAFSPAGDAIAVAASSGSYIYAYPWSVSGFGTKYTDPSLPGSLCTGVAFNSAGSVIACSVSTSPYVNAWTWSSSGFGSKYSNPATLPAGYGRGVAFGIK